MHLLGTVTARCPKSFICYPFYREGTHFIISSMKYESFKIFVYRKIVGTVRVFFYLFDCSVQIKTANVNFVCRLMLF